MLYKKMNLETYNYIFIEQIDYDDIEKIIEESIIDLCWGSENRDNYDIEDVIKEFMIRFKKKSEDQQYGYIGEFLYYIYVTKNIEVLKPVSIFFNQEDRSFKKGFDLLGFDGKEFWYSEVKSGNKKDKDIDQYNLERISTAYRDIKDKIKEKNRNTNYWDTAKSNFCKIKLSSDKDERKKIIEIFNNDRNNSKIENIITVSVIFDDTDEELNIEKIRLKYEELKRNNEKITIICIRKKTIERIIEIIKGVCKKNG